MRLIEVVMLVGAHCVSPVEHSQMMTDAAKVQCAVVIEKDTDRDYFLSAAEARDYGLIDRVIETGASFLVGVPTHAIDLLRELRERGYIISGYEGAVFQKHADSPTGYIIQAPPWIDTATGKFLPEVAKFYLAH